jgi:hypothetical protein
MVLNGIVQERGDDDVFPAPVLNDDGRDAKQMANEWLAFALAALMEVQFGSVTKCIHETIREDRLFGS